MTPMSTVYDAINFHISSNHSVDKCRVQSQEYLWPFPTFRGSFKNFFGAFQLVGRRLQFRLVCCKLGSDAEIITNDSDRVWNTVI